jgi:S-adenosylmethionine decarboxylase
MNAMIWHYSGWIKETSAPPLFDYYMQYLVKSGFSVENVIEKHFAPQGYTALFLLGESHFAIHTFPEAGYTYIELASCSRPLFDRFINGGGAAFPEIEIERAK